MTLIDRLIVFIGGACMLSGVLFVYMILGSLGIVWTPYTCLTDVLERTSTAAGQYFEVSQTSCSGLGKGPAEVSVFASRTGQGKQALIFKYERMHDGSRDAEPVITPVDDRAVRFSVKHVGAIICQSRHWGAVVIQYDIGRVVDASLTPSGECIGD